MTEKSQVKSFEKTKQENCQTDWVTQKLQETDIKANDPGLSTSLEVEFPMLAGKLFDSSAHADAQRDWH